MIVRTLNPLPSFPEALSQWSFGMMKESHLESQCDTLALVEENHKNSTRQNLSRTPLASHIELSSSL